MNLDDNKWKTARKQIAWKVTPGGDPIVIHQVRKIHKDKLAGAGFKTIDDFLKVDPAAVPLESAGINKYAREI